MAGRYLTNCRTHNEPYSYFGIDLGEGRRLLPTCYTLRNRNSRTHVLLNWHFEASNNKQEWTLLDRRIYLTGRQQDDDRYAAERQELCQSGATSTWGVDQEVYDKITGRGGFRYFRVIQVGANSSGSDNLALSGIELYGQVC